MKRRRIPPPKERGHESDYRRLWRLVDGALADTIRHHPEYFRTKDLRAVRQSIAKRVVGAIKGHAEQSARGRSGQKPAAGKRRGHSTTDLADGRSTTAVAAAGLEAAGALCCDGAQGDRGLRTSDPRSPAAIEVAA